MRIGQKIWTLERAIRVMHGRSRQTEDFFPYMYKPELRALRFTAGAYYENGNGVTMRPRTCTWTGKASMILRLTTMPGRLDKEHAGRLERPLRIRLEEGCRYNGCKGKTGSCIENGNKRLH